MFERLVRLTMTRVEYGADQGEPEVEQSGVVENVSWIQKGQAHYLMYDGAWAGGLDNDDDEPMDKSRTIWKLERNQVTLIRHGFVRWTLRFCEGQTTTTTGYLGDTPIAIEVTTKEMSVHVEAQSGAVRVVWDASFGGSSQSVALHLQFETVLP